MAVQIRLLALLALLACVMAAAFARAEDVADDDFDATADDNEETDDDDTDASESKDPNTQFVDGRVYFPGFEMGAPLKLPAGEKVDTYVSFQNKVGGSPSELFIVAAHLNPVGNYDAFVQNFSAVRSMRTVNGGETATVHYEFRPDAMLEPMDYNLVIRVFFLNGENATFVAVAYNSTITISDPLGTDFQAITSYLILIALIGGAIYMFTGKSNNALATANGKKKSFSASPSGKSAASSPIDDKTVNTDYISAEHLKFREKLIKDAAKRAASPKSPNSPNNKKK